MHEWFFRSGLDHFVWVFGMFCAFAFPWFDAKLSAPPPPPPPPFRPATATARVRVRVLTRGLFPVARVCVACARFSVAIESLEASKRTMMKLAVFGVTFGLGAYWYVNYFALPKRQYNKVHPYTSFIGARTQHARSTHIARCVWPPTPLPRRSASSPFARVPRRCCCCCSWCVSDVSCGRWA
jgi:hypothetical protein